jgi:hypothetical protein
MIGQLCPLNQACGLLRVIRHSTAALARSFHRCTFTPFMRSQRVSEPSPKAPGHHNVGPQTERELKKVHGAIDQVRQTGDRHQDAENSSQEGRARADYILYYKYYKPSIPIALIEAGKTTTASATACSRPSTTRPQNSFCVFSKGDGFVFHDRTGTSVEKEATLSLDAFPSGKISGQNTAHGKDSVPMTRQLSCRITSTMAAAKRFATIRPTPSTPR